MLHGNYSVIHKSPGHFLAGSTVAGDRSNFGKNGVKRNFWASANGFSKHNSIPWGYVQPFCLVLAPNSGGMATEKFIVGEGDVTNANLAGGLNAEAALTGDGNITNAGLGLILSAVADLVGSGTLTADIVGILNAAADLSGSGTVSDAALGALASMVAVLSGSGTVASDITAKANISSDIVVTGDLLNTANVASAIWDALAEDNLTYAQVMKILTAVSVGKSTIVDLGGGLATVTFRDVNDTKDRVVANMTDSERTSVTVDGD
jgi:hypothetical protein